MHGFTATRDEELDRFCERFAAVGIAALAFDFRHLGASGGEPRQLVDLRRQYEDCDAALGYARILEGIDPARIVIWGASFAGGHALDAAARNPWLAAAICLVPFVDGARPPRGVTPGSTPWMLGAALRDAWRALRGGPRHFIPAVGPPGSRAAIANQNAYESLARTRPHSLWRNEVAARVLLQIPRHRPVRSAARVRCPLLVQVVEEESVFSNRPAERAAARAQQGELRRYRGLDHFDVYFEPGFETVIEEEIAFLRSAGLIAPAGRAQRRFDRHDDLSVRDETL
jgi:uncharacterized protein